MRVGLDMDGTITAKPKFFAALSRGIAAQPGGRIFVITYRGEMFDSVTRQQLDGLGITYHGVFHAPAGVDAPEWKAAVAKRLRLDVMFEDDERNLAAMPLGVAGFLVTPRSEEMLSEIKEYRRSW